MKITAFSLQRSLTNQMVAMGCLVAVLGLVACQQEGSAEKAGQKIDKAVDKVELKLDQTTDNADKKMDSIKDSVAQQAGKAGDSIDESKDRANDDLKKAGQAIDKAISNTDKQLVGAKEGIVDATGTTSEFVDDSVITTRIKASLVNDEFLKASAIEVTTTNGGVVTLKGSLDSEQLVARAIGLANSQQGVKSVQNQLTIIAIVPSKQ
jgi:hyperosmotically inducible protein